MIGSEIKKSVFRDTYTFYENSSPEIIVAPQLVRFVRRNAGKSILDYGFAVGNYCLHFKQQGYQTTGVDINLNYVNRARQRGVNVHHLNGAAPFPDKSFDTVIIFEVLEHLEHPEFVLQDAKRLARKNVLITTPNSERVDELRKEGLLFEHFADLDHKNIFTPESMHQLLSQYFLSVKIKKGNGINPFALSHFSSLRLLGKALSYYGILHPYFHYRLFAVCKP
ncbi:MAG TPA: hypothetical protein DCQ28_08585 [Bacteroidetes bacterium]|nr:hypothetical protein [Bacteroidota bacterium]